MNQRVIEGERARKPQQPLPRNAHRAGVVAVAAENGDRCFRNPLRTSTRAARLRLFERFLRLRLFAALQMTFDQRGI